MHRITSKIPPSSTTIDQSDIKGSSHNRLTAYNTAPSLATAVRCHIMPSELSENLNLTTEFDEKLHQFLEYYKEDAESKTIANQLQALINKTNHKTILHVLTAITKSPLDLNSLSNIIASLCEWIEAPYSAGDDRASMQQRESAANRLFDAYQNQSEYLNLSDLQLTTLPSALLFLDHVTCINCCNNWLRELPCELADLPRLEALYLSNNPMLCEATSGVVPDIITKIKPLKTLVMNNCGIEFIPDNIRTLSKLQVVELKSNRLHQLPVNITELTQIEILLLNNNHLTTLPIGFQNLSVLRELDCSDNPITYLPDEDKMIAFLMDIKEVTFDNTPIDKIYTVKKYLPDIQAEVVNDDIHYHSLLPNTAKLDRASIEFLRKAESDHTFVGLVNIKTGAIVLVPYGGDPTRQYPTEPYPYEFRLQESQVEPFSPARAVIRESTQYTAHMQALKLYIESLTGLTPDDQVVEKAKHQYIGFSICPHPSACRKNAMLFMDVLHARSRSLNSLKSPLNAGYYNFLASDYRNLTEESYTVKSSHAAKEYNHLRGLPVRFSEDTPPLHTFGSALDDAQAMLSPQLQIQILRVILSSIENIEPLIDVKENLEQEISCVECERNLYPSY